MNRKNKKKAALFIDRDGVLNKLKEENGNLYSPHRLEEFKVLPKISQAIRKAKSLGFITILITNQPDVSRGKITLTELDKMHKLLLKKTLIDDIFICPHDSHFQCHCRKPKNGLIKMAIKKWDIDIKNSFLVGDTWKDIYAGFNSGCKTILVRNPQNYDKHFWSKSDIRYDWSTKNLYDAVKKIEQRILKIPIKET